MKKLTVLFFTLIFFCNNRQIFAQQEYDTLTVAFWNMENLFDTIDDPDKNDEEFLPSGRKEWTAERLNKKLEHHAKAIKSMSSSNGPSILGVCEVEHESLLEELIERHFSDRNYSTAYLESPDNRGIDNGLIYDADLFTCISVSADTVVLPDKYPTRLILNVNLILNSTNDTLITFVNHWPSRRGGQEQSEPNRIAAANTLRKKVDYYFKQNPGSKIIIIGDFNDEPVNNSIINSLNAQPIKCDSLPGDFKITSQDNLYNLSYSAYENGLGSYKYRDDWNMLDQVIVSHSLITNEMFHYVCGSFTVYKPEFLVEQTGKYKGSPFPTYGGSKYLGGYSDHFPVFAKFVYSAGN